MTDCHEAKTKVNTKTNQEKGFKPRWGLDANSRRQARENVRNFWLVLVVNSDWMRGWHELSIEQGKGKPRQSQIILDSVRHSSENCAISHRQLMHPCSVTSDLYSPLLNWLKLLRDEINSKWLETHQLKKKLPSSFLIISYYWFFVIFLENRDILSNFSLYLRSYFVGSVHSKDYLRLKGFHLLSDKISFPWLGN